MTEKATDWDAYYKKPAAPTKVTRRISESKILGLLNPYLAGASVCECGGANSCFIGGFLARADIGRYHVIDYNDYGVSLLAKRYQSATARVSWEVADLLDYQSEAGAAQFDVVYSVGLIEHFGPEGTAACVKSHFDLCKPSGVVLMTFPTPTPLYSAIRSVAEATGQWAFHDERPLSFGEVELACAPHTQLHRSINWAIGLTQGYLMYRKVQG